MCCWGVAKGSSVSWVAKFKGDKHFRMQAAKGVVAKLQGDKTASFSWEMRSREVTGEINQHPNLPWNFITHAFLDPSAFPELSYDPWACTQLEPPVWGRQKGVTPICSDFPFFLLILFRFAFLKLFTGIPHLFRFALISSDLFRFVFRTSQNKSGKPLSADPFCQTWSPTEFKGLTRVPCMAAALCCCCCWSCRCGTWVGCCSETTKA